MTSSAFAGAKLLGGYFSNDFITLFIKAAGQSFLQVHRSNKDLDLLAILDNKILNYKVLDFEE